MQKSEDGKTFLALEKIPARNQPAATYQYVDTKAEQSIMYYRIRVKEYDASTSYSVIRSLQRQSPEMTVGDAYPNPSQDEVFLPMTSPQAGMVHWAFVNALGQVAAQGIQSVATGSQLLTFSTTQLPGGWYQLSLKMEQEERSVTVFKQN